MPWSRDARWPARLAYQVCEWTRSAPAASAAICRSTPIVARDGFASASCPGTRYASTRSASRSPPKHLTLTSRSVRMARTNSVTCTPAPPYTSGGYSLVKISTLTIVTLVQTKSGAYCWGHGFPEDLRNRTRRRRREAADAAHRRPCQASRAIRRQLPAGRLRVVQPHQLGNAPDRRVDAVQVAQPRPPRVPDLAAVGADQLIRGIRPCPAAPRQAVVRRISRRDPAEPQPVARRKTRHCRGCRRRPRVPHGLQPDDRRACRVGGGRSEERRVGKSVGVGGRRSM